MAGSYALMHDPRNPTPFSGSSQTVGPRPARDAGCLPSAGNDNGLSGNVVDISGKIAFSRLKAVVRRAPKTSENSD